MSANGTLFAWTHDRIELQGALAACARLWQGQAPVALAYSRDRASLLRVQVTAGGAALELALTERIPAQIFEARVFCEAGELRWLNVAGQGRAAYLSGIDNAPSDKWARADVDYRSSIRGEYLLFGQGLEAGSDPGSPWSSIGNARIGAWPVPVAGVSAGKGVALKYIEYLGLAPGRAGDEHGNVCVVEQRLTGLALA